MELSEKAQSLLVNAARGKYSAEGRFTIGRHYFRKNAKWYALCIAGGAMLDGDFTFAEIPPMTYRAFLEYVDAARELVEADFAQEVEESPVFRNYTITLKGYQAADHINLESKVNEVLDDDKATDFFDNPPSP